MLIGTACILLYPLLWMIASSLKPEQEIFSHPGLLPSKFVWSNYARGWEAFGVSFTTFFRNSFLICVLAVVGTVTSSALAAYAFARLRFPLRRLWFALMMGTIMLPVHVTLIPQYIMFNRIGWVNTYLPLVFPKFFATDAFFIFLMVQFIRGIPVELDQAAKIDGCGPVRTFRYIILPLLMPALVTASIFTFIWTYNDFFSQLIYLNSANLYTVPLGLRQFLDNTDESMWGPLFAMSCAALVPVFIIFLAFQRHILEGIATTGLKG